jgi:hypothetical protein
MWPHPDCEAFSNRDMAVCVYHVSDHARRIAIRLDEFLPDSKLTLRTYNADGFDCVCYCIPD